MMRGITAKAKKATTSKSKVSTSGPKGQPQLDEFIMQRDYTGALALLEFRLKCQDGDTKVIIIFLLTL